MYFMQQRFEIEYFFIIQTKDYRATYAEAFLFARVQIPHEGVFVIWAL